MLLNEAKMFVGQVCTICYRDRAGAEHTMVSKIHDATFVPMYGGYLVTDTDDLRLDRVCSVEAVATAPATGVATASREKVAV